MRNHYTGDNQQREIIIKTVSILAYIVFRQVTSSKFLVTMCLFIMSNEITFVGLVKNLIRSTTLYNVK